MNLSFSTCLTVFALALCLSPSAAQAKEPAVVLAPCLDKTGNGLGRRVRSALARALKAKGVQLFSYRSYLAAARSGRIKPKKALRRDAIRKLAGPLGLSGVVTSDVQRSGRRYLFTFRLYDSKGKVRIKRVFRSKRPSLSSRQIWRMARQMAGKLGAGSGPLVGHKPHSRSLILEEPPTVTDDFDQLGHPQASKLASRLSSEVDLISFYTSNLFLDRSEQYDFAVKPSIDLDYDFSPNWSVGYSGELNTYIRHEALLSHWHQLNLMANPEKAAVARKLKEELFTKLKAQGDPRMFGKGEVFDRYP